MGMNQNETNFINGFRNGMNVCIADGWNDSGKRGRVIGYEVFFGQWWCPVLWDGDEDPEFYKSEGLIPDRLKSIGEIVETPAMAERQKIVAWLLKKADYIIYTEVDEHRGLIVRGCALEIENGKHLTVTKTQK